MRPLLRVYDWLTSALAVIAGVMMVLIFVGIIVDVTIRNIGYTSPREIQPLAEFGLLYITMLGSPWLLRQKGMIIVESLRMALPSKARRALEIAVYLICIAACSVLSYYAMYQTIFSWETDAADQRAITVPLIYAYAPIFLGFFLMDIEFVRLLLSGDTIYGTSATERDVV
jgi:C4-dicarboxylate transporter, DctQ subunit